MLMKGKGKVRESTMNRVVTLMKEINEIRKVAPGPPPRPGLEWREDTKRWVRPQDPNFWGNVQAQRNQKQEAERQSASSDFWGQVQAQREAKERRAKEQEAWDNNARAQGLIP